MGSFWLLADATEIHWQEPLLDRCNEEVSVKKVRKLTGQKDLKHIIYYEGNDMRRNTVILQMRNIFWSFVLFAKYFCSSVSNTMCCIKSLPSGPSYLYNF